MRNIVIEIRHCVGVLCMWVRVWCVCCVCMDLNAGKTKNELCVLFVFILIMWNKSMSFDRNTPNRMITVIGTCQTHTYSPLTVLRLQPNCVRLKALRSSAAMMNAKEMSYGIDESAILLMMMKATSCAFISMSSSAFWLNRNWGWMRGTQHRQRLWMEVVGIV